MNMAKSESLVYDQNITITTCRRHNTYKLYVCCRVPTQ
jgi:hypothetical protein